MGSCEDKDIAARVLTRIIGHFPGKRNQMIIDAGFLALSEQGFKELGGTLAIIKVCSYWYFCGIVRLTFAGMGASHLTSRHLK